MWIRLLKLCAQRPLAALGVLLVCFAALSTSVAVAVGGEEDPGSAEVSPRMLIGRAWFDRYPEKARDEVNLFIFFGSGFGLHEHGSRYRATVDFFEFERQGDSVELTFFHDKKQHKTRFSLKACKDDDNFDLCLDLESSPRGPKRYYSWGSADEEAARVPWLLAWKRGVEDRARAPR